MTNELLPTTVVGSCVQPEWLVDRKNLKGRLPLRIRAHEIWRVDPEFLESAQNDATLLAIHDMERAGIDIVTDGEVRRESYSNRVATALGGVDTKKSRNCNRSDWSPKPGAPYLRTHSPKTPNRG